MKSTILQRLAQQQQMQQQQTYQQQYSASVQNCNAQMDAAYKAGQISPQQYDNYYRRIAQGENR